jgi:peptide/nickel transport system substrate-binding protein
MIAKLITTVALAVAVSMIAQADEPKHGGILHIYHRETPPSLSVHEEATFSVNVPAMGLFNNLVIYDQHKPQNSMGDIVPELATSWAWDSAGTTLTFKLREGVTWHDGKPFTAKDIKCTFDLLRDKAQDKFRKNPRRDLFNNVSEVTTNGDFEVAFHLKRPQPSLLAMIASGYTPMYPCHVTPAAPGRISSSSSSRMSRLSSRGTKTIGRRDCLISTASNSRSSAIERRPSSPSSPAKSI